MNRLRLILPCVLLIVAAPVLADTRLALRPYMPDTIFDLDTRPGFETAVQFADGERVENVAIGDSANWQVTPNKRANLVFVKPAGLHAPVTNMTVVTDLRTYLFSLHVARNAQFLLRFAYPAPPPPPATAKEAEKPDPLPALRQPPAPARLNFAWKTSGDKGLVPSMLFDDGQSVYLAWPEGHALPAVLEPAPDGKGTGPVNSTLSGPYTVVDGRHDVLILQSGKRMARLTNLAPATLPEPPPAAAITPLPAASPAAPSAQAPAS